MTDLPKFIVTQVCKHNATPFTFQAGNQSYTLYLSAYRGRTRPKVTPTAGLYLDPGWLEGSFFRLDGSKPYKRLKVAFLNWPDCSQPSDIEGSLRMGRFQTESR